MLQLSPYWEMERRGERATTSGANLWDGGRICVGIRSTSSSLALLNSSFPEVVLKWFLLVTLIVFGGLTSAITGVDQRFRSYSVRIQIRLKHLCLSGFTCHLVYLPVPLRIARVSVYTAPLDSHTCCVYYDSRPDPPHFASSPSRWQGRAGDEQEGNDIMAFLMAAWHKADY